MAVVGWSDSDGSQAAQAARARHPHSRAALARHGPSRGGPPGGPSWRGRRCQAGHQATRRSLADIAEAAHQEDVAEAVALEEALTVSSREAALLEQRKSSTSSSQSTRR